MLALIATTLVAGSALAATPFGKNLVKNPGAESGSTGLGVEDWDTGPDFATGAYGGSGMPSKKQGKSIDGGKQLFSSGPYLFNFDTCGSALQLVKIKGLNDQIDDGRVRITLSGALGTKTKADKASVTVQFRDGNNHQITSKQLTLGPVKTKLKMVEKTASQIVPRGTRVLRVQLNGDVVSQTCDAFFDNISVVLDPT